MAHKRDEGIFEILTQLPWWVSVIVAALVYAFLAWILPSLAGQSVLLKGLAIGLSANAWLFACLFLIPIPLALLNSLGGRRGGPSTGPRRKREDTFDILSTLPWWVSIVAGVLAYVFFKWIFPALAGESVFLKAMSQAFRGNAGLLAALFLIPALASYVGARRRRQLLDSQTGIESIRAMSWQNFELLVGESFRRQNYVVEERGGSAPDGGVDLVLRKDGKTTLVQCKRWREKQVSVQPVRELYGVMHREQAHGAIFVSSGRYTADAAEFARGQPIRLIDGEELASMVAGIQGERAIGQRLAKALEPSRSAPQAVTTCPTCGSSMVRRTAKRGSNAGQAFWGCSRYPSCKGTRPM